MKTQTKVSKWALIVAIVIILNMFINYAMSVIYTNPQYDDFCEELRKPVAVEMTPEQIEKDNQCWEQYDEARGEFEDKVFVTLISIGVLIFGISFFAKNYVLSTSLSLGATLNFVIASMRYWGEANDILKLVILGIALVILVGIGIKKFSE